MEELIDNFEKYKIDFETIFIPKNDYIKSKIDEFLNLNNMITDLIQVYSNYDNEEYFENFSLLLKIKLDNNMENISYYLDTIFIFHNDVVNRLENLSNNLSINNICEIENISIKLNDSINNVNFEDNTYLIKDLLFYFNNPEIDQPDDDILIEFLNISKTDNYYTILSNFNDAYVDNYDDYYENNESEYKIVYDDNFKNTLDKIYPTMSYKEENIKDPVAFFLFVKNMNSIANDILELYEEIKNLVFNFNKTNEYFLDFLQSLIDEINKLENKDIEDEKEYYKFFDKYYFDE